MIAIVNVDKNLRETGPHEYEVRINRKPLFRFKHNREDSIASLFGRAQQAAWDAEAEAHNNGIHSDRQECYKGQDKEG